MANENQGGAAQQLAERVLAYVAPPPKNRANPLLDADMELQALAWTVLDGLGYPPALPAGEVHASARARLVQFVEAMQFPRNRLPTDAMFEVYANSPKDKAHHLAEDILDALSPSEQPEPVALEVVGWGRKVRDDFGCQWVWNLASLPGRVSSKRNPDPTPYEGYEPLVRQSEALSAIAAASQPLYAQPSEQTGETAAIKAARKYLLQIQEGREVRQEDGSTRMEDWDGDKVSTLAGKALAALSTAGGTT